MMDDIRTWIMNNKCFVFPESEIKIPYSEECFSYKTK